MFILVFILIVAFSNFNYKENFTPLIDKQLGYEGLLEASTKIYFCYFGFDFITTISEETINPVKEVPRSILYSNLICTISYIGVAFSVNGVMNLSEVLKKNGGNTTTALVDAF